MRNSFKTILFVGLVLAHIQGHAGLSDVAKRFLLYRGDPSAQASQDEEQSVPALQPQHSKLSTEDTSPLSPPQDVPSSDQNARTYLAKYLAYEFWVLHLPDSPQPAFIQFIEPMTPLTQKLREKWLYRLAEKQDWLNFKLYYRPTENTGLRCYAQLAEYKGEHKQEAVQNAFALWLIPATQSSNACHKLFTLLQHDHAFSPTQMKQKIAQALAQNRSTLAYALLLRMGPAYALEAKMLTLISHNPKHIMVLQPGPLAGALSLYGLNLLLSRSLEAAITLWQTPHLQKLLSTQQSQQFLAHLALYKTMRNQKDAGQWFAKVQPRFRDEVLRDWGVRYALMQENWQEILQITEQASLVKNEPFQVYWRARALDKLGHHSAALPLYHALALKRHYYGFLASIALHQKLQFEAEPTAKDLSLLAIYKPITDQIATYYRTKQTYLAAHMLNEFSLELSKTEKSALVYWVATHLHWTGKAIYLSTTDEGLKNQLALRFPLSYQQPIQKLANHYHISPALIYATIRQESTFLEDIKSDAGAYGLMQILPSTAKNIAKQEKIPYLDAKDLFHPEKNLQIGVAYLNTLHHQFKAHPVLIMAAYNAGPKQVRQWVTRHSPKEIDIWIETLPWQETRNYLKNVIAFYAVYQYRMQQKPNLSSFLQPF